MTYRDALREALDDAMNEDDSIVLLGEDITTNLYGYSDGLVEKYHEKRVIDIPLSEATVMGMCAGMAIRGIRPVLDLTIPNFMYITMDQLANIVAKMQYMYNGKYRLPLTVITSIMAGSGNASQHSDRLFSLLMGIPGLKVICPSSPQRMYSMLRAAINEDNPVICFTDRSLFWKEENIIKTNEKHIDTRAEIVREGSELTIVSIAGVRQMVVDLDSELSNLDIDYEHINISYLTPVDMDTILESIKKTKKLVLCDSSNRTGSVASHIAAEILLKGVYLDKSVGIVTSLDYPVPFGYDAERIVLLTGDKILEEVKRVIGR